MSDPLVIRVAANISEMKTTLSNDGLTTLETYKSALNSASNAYDGSRIVAQASAAAKAIENAGGVSALTGAEQAKANAIFTEAAAKLQLMGQGGSYAAGVFRDLAAATAGANPPTEKLGESWVARVAEGLLLRDAIREVIDKVQELAEYFPELAERGAKVGDVEKNFERLTAAAGQSGEVLLGVLRQGLQGTVDDMALMQATNKSLAAGIVLTNDQWKVLAQGAFSLAKATGGDVTTAFNTMSDAMVTGRARGVAELTGKIDLQKAELAYANQLGRTTSELTEDQKLQADRQAILTHVGDALGRVGTQQLSLADRVEQGKTSWANYQDEVGKAIAQSPAITAGISTLQTAFTQAFGGDRQASIAAIVSIVKTLGLGIVDIGIGTTAVAGVSVQAWNALKVPILALEADIAKLLLGLLKLEDGALALEGKLTLTSSSTDRMRASFAGLTENVRQTAAGLELETEEATKAAQGHSAAQQQIEKFGGVLFQVRDAMEAASDATATETDNVTKATGAISTHSDALEADAKTQREYALKTKELWNQHYTDLADFYATDVERAVNAANRKYQDAVDKAQAAHITDQGYYAALEAIREDDVQKALIDNNKLRSSSEESLQAMAGKADATYKAMTASGLHFTADALLQLQQWRDGADAAANGVKLDFAALNKFSVQSLQDNYTNAQAMLEYVEANASQYTRAAIDHFREMRDKALDAFRQIQGGSDQAAQQVTATWNGVEGKGADAAAALLDAFNKSVKEVIKTTDALISGSDYTYDLTTKAGLQDYMKLNPGANITDGNKVMQLAQQGQTLQQLIAEGYIDPYYKLKQEHPEWGNLQGFAGGTDSAPGGLAWVGELGPELVNLPRGSQVIPIDQLGAVGGITIEKIEVQGNVIGTQQQLADLIGKAVMAQLKLQGNRFPVTAGA